MKFTLVAALVCGTQAVTIKSHVAVDDWEADEHGAIGGGGYERKIPDNFSGDADDIFMRSMYNSYATELNSAKPDDKPVESGVFMMSKANMNRAAKEVLCTHKQICDDAYKTYAETYFEKAWGRFDVNGTGSVEIAKTPSFMRFLASDQLMSLQ